MNKSFKSSLFVIICLSFLLSLGAEASQSPGQIPSMDFDRSTLTGRLLHGFHNASDAADLDNLKELSLESGGQSISALIRVMKDSRFPDQSRWTSIFLLAQIAGEKSLPVLERFLEHPNWMMKVASLKALLALGAEDYGDMYADLLTDNSLLVRTQALENIRNLGLSQYAPQVWAMLYDKNNYDQVSGNSRRGDIIRTVILTIGDLGFQEAKEPLLRMIQQDRYNDIFNEIDHSLQKITGRTSPKDSQKNIRRMFWQRVAMTFANI